MPYTKSKLSLRRKMISMLTDLKVSSLACKCVFYRPENNAKVEPHGTEFWRSWNVKTEYTYEECSKSRWEKWVICLVIMFPAGIYLFKVSNRNTRTRCEICSKLTIKASERHLVLVFLLLTLNMQLPTGFTLRVTVIKMSELSNYLHFLLTTIKN